MFMLNKTDHTFCHLQAVYFNWGLSRVVKISQYNQAICLHLITLTNRPSWVAALSFTTTTMHFTQVNRTYSYYFSIFEWAHEALIVPAKSERSCARNRYSDRRTTGFWGKTLLTNDKLHTLSKFVFTVYLCYLR